MLLSGAVFAQTSFASADEAEPLYKSDYNSKAEAREAGLALNEQISEEGMILLKNENNTLPLATSATNKTKITVLGYAGVAPNAGASLHGGDTSAGAAVAYEDIYSGLEGGNYELNPTVKAQYEDWADMENVSSDSAIANLTDGNDFATKSATWTNLDEYNTAMVVISAGSNPIGSEEGQRVHTLQLDDEQYELVEYAKDNFDTVIVLVNSCTPIEMSAIQNDSEVDACDFAVKPVTNADFYIKMRKAVRRVRRGQDDIITFKMMGSVAKISASNIYYVEVIKHDLIYHTVSGEIKSHGTMRDVEEKLKKYSFYRVHHSYLVNLAHVYAVQGDFIVVNGTEIKISRSKKLDFMEKFAKFAEGR